TLTEPYTSRKASPADDHDKYKERKMKKIVLLMIVALSLGFSSNNGLTLFGSYNMADKLKFKYSGYDWSYNLNGGGVGYGVSYQQKLGESIGIRLSGMNVGDRKINSYTVANIETAVTSNASASQTLIDADVMLFTSNGMYGFIGLNYSMIKTNATSTFDSGFGWQGGIGMSADALSLECKYRVINTILRGSNGINLDGMSLSGIEIAGRYSF
ncbi:MAG: hypothetical protein AABZ14_00170, partial [Candidatus Margulisiibacteriota bacterium]